MYNVGCGVALVESCSRNLGQVLYSHLPVALQWEILCCVGSGSE